MKVKKQTEFMFNDIIDNYEATTTAGEVYNISLYFCGAIDPETEEENRENSLFCDITVNGENAGTLDKIYKYFESIGRDTERAADEVRTRNESSHADTLDDYETILAIIQEATETATA